MASTSASAKLMPGHDRSAGERAGKDRERQADAEQPQRHRVLAAQRAQRDPRGIGEQDERQRDLREPLDRLALELEVEQPEHRPGEEAAVVKNIAPETFTRWSRLETVA